MLYVSVKTGNLGYLQIEMDDPFGKLSNQEEKLTAFLCGLRHLYEKVASEQNLGQ